jgi:hypothetical protein
LVGAADCDMVTADTQTVTAGVFVSGNPGTFGTPVRVTAGVSAPNGGGAFCKACVLVSQGDVAPSAGSFYTSPDSGAQMGQQGFTAPSIGMFCQGGSGTVGWESSSTVHYDCVTASAGTQTLSAGVGIPGSPGAWGTPVWVTAGSSTPVAGAFCKGCVFSSQGDVAPSAGSFWPNPNSDVQMVQQGSPATSAGMFCQLGTGNLPTTIRTAASSSWRSGSLVVLVIPCLSMIIS